MNEMKQKEIAGKKLYCNPFTEEYTKMDTEDQEIYLFLRGGLTAK
ncbi:MAG: hypothetical protein WC556_07110 [Candidatus Methanoperedens sp.]